MNSRRGTQWMLVGLLALVMGRPVAAGITASQVSGEVKAGPSGAAQVTVATGANLAMGTVITTGRDGRLVGAIDAQNRFALQPETTVRLQDGKGASGLALELRGGRVDSTLNAWPAGSVYEVRTAAGTFTATGTVFGASAALGAAGEAIGGAEVANGEVAYACPECTIASVTANGGVGVTRIEGLESVLLEIKAIGNDLTLVVGGRQTIQVPAGSTVRIAIARRHLDRFAAVEVAQGSATIGAQTLAAGAAPVFIANGQILPNAGAAAFLSAVRTEATAYAQLQMPGLSAEQRAALTATQENAARAVLEAAANAGLVAAYQPPFVTERPLSRPFSPSGTP